MKSKNPEITNLLDRKKRATSKTRKEKLELVIQEIERRKTERPILHLVDKREYKKPEFVEYSIDALAKRYGIPSDRFSEYLFSQKNNFQNLKK